MAAATPTIVRELRRVLDEASIPDVVSGPYLADETEARGLVVIVLAALATANFIRPRTRNHASAEGPARRRRSLRARWRRAHGQNS